MSTHEALLAWATEEFGHASLGDLRRNRRLIAMAARVAQKPAGTVTAVFEKGADRLGAYQFLENPEIEAEAVADAAHLACVARCEGEPYVFVPIDGTSLCLTDMTQSKGFGSVGTHRVGARGLKVMNAIAVRADGTPLGLCAQVFWARQPVAKSHQKRSIDEKESRFWLQAIRQATDVFSRSGSKVRPWFQLDREADAWPILLEMTETGQWATIRASHDRCVEGAHGRLWPMLESQPSQGHYEVHVPARGGRKPRVAKMEVRATPVELRLREHHSGRPMPSARLHAVLVREVGRVPEGEKPLEWLLLTTFPVETFIDSCRVVQGYVQRWRIEEFHKAWKTGQCQVEASQLRDRQTATKWAVILASVAMRLLRLTYLSRREPDLPAETEFEPDEIKAICLLRFEDNRKRRPKLGQTVLWLAELGGYTGKSSGGPPGMVVLARGLKQLQAAVHILRTLALSRS